MELNPLTMFGGVAALGVIASFWSQIKSYAFMFYSLFVVTISSSDSEFRVASQSYFDKNFKRSNFYINDVVHFTLQHVIPLNNRRNVLAKTSHGNNAYTLWKGWKYLSLSSSYSKDLGSYVTNISFFRLFFNKEKLLKEIEEYYNNINHTISNRYYVEKYIGTLGETIKPFENTQNQGAIAVSSSSDNSHKLASFLFWKNEEIGEAPKISPIDNMALNENCLDAIKEAKRWINSEKWFKSKGVPWKRGLLLFGSAGNGKSSLVKALAQEINVPIMVFDMSTMTNKDFSKYWNQVISNTPCIVLLEDIDAVFDGRKNLSTCDGALSFDCLLNHLDGVQANDGIFTIITTNNIDKIDSAIGIPNGDNISTRPGRIDRAIEMVNPDEAGRYKIAKRILNDFPEKIDETVKAGNHDTGAQFQERCARIALNMFWNKKEGIKNV